MNSMSETFEFVSSLHPNLEMFINGAIFSQKDFILSILSSRVPFEKNAKKTILEYTNFLQRPPKTSGSEVKLSIKPYEGNNPFVHIMSSYLRNNLKDSLVGVYVHGSLGTNEEIAYSDFDALVIVNDAVFQSQKRLCNVASKLSSARSIMYDFDPLQHHGWFVLTESELGLYPNSYFPIELFKHAKSLFPDKGLELKVKIQGYSENNRDRFFQLSNSIINKLQNRVYPKNVYQLKFLLSKFMLLPAIYFQAKHKKGIHKKFSFREVKKDFSEEEWRIMDDISLLRENWSYKMTPLKRWFFTKPLPLCRYFMKKFAPSIPAEIKKNLTSKFYERICKLTINMQKRIQ